MRHRLFIGALAAAVTAVGGLVATPAAAQEGTILGAGAAGAIPDRYVVVLKDKAAAVDSAAQQLARSYGGQVRFTYQHAVRGFSVTLPERQARRLAADPRVEYVEQVGMARIADTQSNPPWGLDRIDQRDRPLNQSYTYPTNGGSGVTIYVLDTGARMTHSQFSGRISAGPDYIDNDSNPSDCNGHGTHVAGSAAGSTYGVAKKARIVPVRVLDCNGSGGWDVIVRGVDWVTANAVKPAVANMSLGGSGSQATLESAVRRSISSGVTYALAGGNNNSSACNFTPARLAEAITVGNSTSSDAKSGTSNYGSCLDIWAPGTSILSAWHTGDSATNTITGTSMASPHVAGAAALYLAQNTNASPQQVRNALVDQASSGKLTGIGSGSPNLLLYMGFLNGGGPGPSPTPTPTPTASPTTPPGDRTFTNDTDYPILDNYRIYSPIGSTATGQAVSPVTVTVNISHTCEEDLGISLIAPDGTIYAVKYSSYGTCAVWDGEKSFNVNVSEAAAGTWQLRVTDYYANDTGTLHGWSLTL